MKNLYLVMIIFHFQGLFQKGNAEDKPKSFARKCQYFLGVGFRLEETDKAQMCLFWSKERKNFAEAKLDCEDKGATLAFPKTPKLLQILLQLSKNDSRNVWIGLDDWSGQYIWHDGTPLENQAASRLWSRGEPNHWNISDEYCVMVWQQRQLLADTSCSIEEHYACEMD